MDTKIAEYANLQKKYGLYGNDKQKSKIYDQG